MKSWGALRELKYFVLTLLSKVFGVKLLFFFIIVHRELRHLVYDKKIQRRTPESKTKVTSLQLNSFMEGSSNSTSNSTPFKSCTLKHIPMVTHAHILFFLEVRWFVEIPYWNMGGVVCRNSILAHSLTYKPPNRAINVKDLKSLRSSSNFPHSSTFCKPLNNVN